MTATSDTTRSDTTRQDQQSQAPEMPPSVARVGAIRLTGQPQLFVLDGDAIWGGDGTHAAGILAKLALLAEHEGTRVVVRGVNGARRDALAARLPADRLVIGTRPGPADLPGLLAEQHVDAHDCLAFLAVAGASVPGGCLAFFTGPGAPPAHAHATREHGPAATDAILALYGTALAQERAGVAFRATSEGHTIPDAHAFDPGILHGIIRSAERPGRPNPAKRQPLPDAAVLRALAQRAYDRLRRNIQPNGAVVGSPARGKAPGEPNYWFFWQRDGAAAMSRLIAWHARAPLGLRTGDLGPTIAHYVTFLTGTQARGHLGTSRYSVEGEPILGYGNPQLDGPALSALALARVTGSAEARTAQEAQTALKTYLDFLLTPQGAGQTMDAWEFIYGRLYNADSVRYAALLAGSARGGQADGDDSDGAASQRYRAGAEQTRHELRAYEEAGAGRLVSALDTHNPWFTHVSRLDAAVISALLVGWWARHDGVLPAADSAGETVGTAPGSLAAPAALATLAALEDVFQPLYRVNHDWLAGGNEGWGLGRFPEDANDGVGSTGGNPWPLSTLWAAQYYYGLAQELARHLDVSGGSLTLPDARQAAFLARAATGTAIVAGRAIPPGTWRERILPALVRRGDGYLNFVVRHMPEDGAITEQIDRDTGQPRGARDLSWALAELIATIALREEVAPLTQASRP